MSQSIEYAFKEFVQEVLKDTPVNVDDVEGLDDKISGEVESQLQNYTPELDIDNVSGLQECVREEVQDQIKDSIGDAVNRELDDVIDEKILTALKEHDDIRNAVKEIVKEYMKEFIGRVVAGG